MHRRLQADAKHAVHVGWVRPRHAPDLATVSLERISRRVGAITESATLAVDAKAKALNAEYKARKKAQSAAAKKGKR